MPRRVIDGGVGVGVESDDLMLAALHLAKLHSLPTTPKQLNAIAASIRARAVSAGISVKAAFERLELESAVCWQEGRPLPWDSGQQNLQEEATADADSTDQCKGVETTANPGITESGVHELPVELARLNQWVGWKRVMRDGPGSKPTKIPYQLNHPHQKAATNKPSTWASYRDAVAIDSTLHPTEKHADQAKGFAGIGFVFTGTDLAGVDFDGVRDPQTGAVEQWACDIIEELNSYTEISQSETGLHTIVELTRPLAKASEGGRYRAGRIEMYDGTSPRFFATTANVYGTFKPIRKLDLTTLQKQLPRLDPKAQSSAKSPSGGDQSQEDFALACRLARRFHCDRQKVTEEFRRQAVKRDKVTTREDYVPRTVEAAIRTVANADDWRSSVLLDLVCGYDAGDVGNGQRFLAMHRAHVLCDDRRGRSPVWYRWEDKRWQEVSEGVVREMAHQVGLQYVKQGVEWRSPNPDKNLAQAEEALVRKTAMSYLITKVLNNAVTEARPYVLVKIEEFDSNCDLLNFTNGTLDISTDPPTLREHRRDDRITRLIDFDYDPNATCPEFLRFLITTMGGNPDSAEDTSEQKVAEEMTAYLQQIFGCTLSADVRDKKIFIFNGDTDTGKTTLLQTVHGVIPDYAVTIPIEALMTEDRNSSIEESLASLRGKRMAITSETGRYHTLNVARIKQITQGNDRAEISVVPKYKPQITFKATHHLFMDCNFRPRIRGGDDATWNRLEIVNFPHRIPRDQQIKNMSEILLQERQGIMTWMIQGLVAFRKAGMKLPAVEDMEMRLRAWRNESERLRDFLDAKCWLESEWTRRPDGQAQETNGTIDGAEITLSEDWEWTVAQNELWKSYCDWIKTQEDDKRMKKAEFYGDIESLPGVTRGRPRFGKKLNRTQKDGFFGIALKTI